MNDNQEHEFIAAMILVATVLSMMAMFSGAVGLLYGKEYGFMAFAAFPLAVVLIREFKK